MWRSSLILLTLLCCAVSASAQSITTVAGTGVRAYGGDGGPATSAQLQFPFGVMRDTAGNLYIVDEGNQVIRRVDATTGIITTVAGNGTACADSTTPCGDGGAATSAQLNNPQAVIVDSAGNLFIADGSNHRVRRVDAGTGIITTIAGTGVAGFGGDGAAATSAQLNGPTGLALDGSGNLYIADFFNHRVRRVSGGNIDSVAGTGTAGYNGDGIAATTADLDSPFGVGVDSAGNFYIAEFVGQRVRRVTVASGLISTVAGTGTGGYNGDGIAATTAQLNGPTGVDVDASGNVFIADFGNLRIRRVDAGTGNISTVAGNGTACADATTPCGDGGPATSAQLTDPAGLDVDANQNVFIADTGNSKIRQVYGPADLSVTTTDAPDPVNVGSDLTYTVTVTNSGPNPVTNVTMTDALPANIAFQSLASPAGWTCTTPAVGSTGTVSCTAASLAVASPAIFTIVIRPGAGAVGTLNNTATVATADQVDPNAANNSASTSTTVNASADLNVTKSDAPDPVNVGADVTYTVVVTNNGPNDAATVTLSDPLPANTTFQAATPQAGWTCTTPAVGAGGTVSCSVATLANAASATFSIVARVGTAAAGTITNTATLSSATNDPVTADNSASATTTVNAVADLSVTKTDAPDPVVVGSNVTYTLTVANSGPSAATSVVLTDTLPAGVTFVSATAPCTQAAGTVTCNLGTINSGANTSITIVITPTAAGTLNNSASVTSAVTDPNNANNTAAASTTVNPAPDFQVSVTPNPYNLPSGLTGVLTVTVTPNVSGFANPVALTCANLPPLAACTFTPASVTPGTSAVTSQLQITTSGDRLARPLYIGQIGPWIWGALGVLAFAVLVFPPARRRRLGFVLALVVGAMIFQAGCAEERPSTPAGTYSVTITGASSSVTRSTVLTLVVR